MEEKNKEHGNLPGAGEENSKPIKLEELMAEDKMHIPIIVSYNERVRERRILESEEELDGLITEYNVRI